MRNKDVGHHQGATENLFALATALESDQNHSGFSLWFKFREQDKTNEPRSVSYSLHLMHMDFSWLLVGFVSGMAGEKWDVMVLQMGLI